MEFLDSIPRTTKVSVVSIAGPYRTGKSFLANRLLNQSKGFEIGSTTQACTKGIWIWNRPVHITQDQVMLLLDTEGLASTERSTNVDIKIFTLSILLSSLFIYNQMGPITENSMEDLSLVANLTNYIHIQHQSQKETGADFRAYFPHFFWVMRDFFHDLEGQTPKQYLEECLQPSPGISQDTLKKNNIRDAITKYFKDRECFAFIRPVADESKLAHIDDLKFEELKTDFRKQVTNFVKEVKKKLKPKSINGKQLNSSMFLALAIEYTEAINSKETPTVITAVERVVQAEAKKIQDEMYDRFQMEIDTEIHEDNMPLDEDYFNKIVRKTIKRNQQSLHRQLSPILNFQELLQESSRFNQRIRDLVIQKTNDNYSASYHYSIGLLKKLYKALDNAFTQDNQFDSHFIHDYVKRWLDLCKEYKELGKCLTQWECFAESVVKMPDAKALFVKRELINFDQDTATSQGMGEEQDEMTSSTTANSQLYVESQPYAFSIYESMIDQAIDYLNDQMTKLRITLSETQQSERKLSQKKKQSDQFIELQRSQNEDLVNIKHDLEMKIDNLQREIQSRVQELESLKQVKELEIKNFKRNQDRQIKDKDDEIQMLQQQKQQHEQVFNSTQSKVQDLDSEKRKEISSIQNEIKKLEEDVEELKTKMKNKENNPHFIQVNQFFIEVKDYIEEFKTKIFDQQEDSKKQKVRLFNLQKQLGDIEYQANQNELKLKKQLDENLRMKKDELERDLDLRQVEIDQERNKIQMLQDKKQLYEQQIDNYNNSIAEALERQKIVRNNYDVAVRQTSIKQAKINEVGKGIQDIQDTQLRIEEQIYKISIENKQKQEDKEIMLMLLPQIYKAINGRSNNIKGFLNQMESDAVKSKVQKLFIAYKIPFK